MKKPRSRTHAGRKRKSFSAQTALPHDSSPAEPWVDATGNPMQAVRASFNGFPQGTPTCATNIKKTFEYSLGPFLRHHLPLYKYNLILTQMVPVWKSYQNTSSHTLSHSQELGHPPPCPALTSVDGADSQGNPSPSCHIC